jgi:hypothetical protein
MIIYLYPFSAGDEVQVGCYNSSDRILAFMRHKGFNTSCPPKDLSIGGSSSNSSSSSDGHARKLSKNPCANGGRGFKNLVAYFIQRAQSILRAQEGAVRVAADIRPLWQLQWHTDTAIRSTG